jgi:hypothetical protein
VQLLTAGRNWKARGGMAHILNAAEDAIIFFNALLSVSKSIA